MRIRPILLALVLLAAGCSDDGPQRRPSPTAPMDTPGPTPVVVIGDDITVGGVLVPMPDGSMAPCAWMDGYKSGALDCNFAAAIPPSTTTTTIG